MSAKRLKLKYVKGHYSPMYIMLGEVWTHDGEIVLSHDVKSEAELEFAVNSLKADLDAILVEGRKELASPKKLFADMPAT